MRVLHDIFDSLPGVEAGARLQEPDFFVEKSDEPLYILAFVHYFEFVCPVDTPGLGLRRARHPVDSLRNRQRAVCFDLNEETTVFQCFDERLVELEERLSAGSDKMTGLERRAGVGNFVASHFCECSELGVAEVTAAVAPREAQEYSRCSGMVSFALEAHEYFVDAVDVSLFHRQQCFLRFPAPPPGSSWRRCRISSVRCFLQ